MTTISLAYLSYIHNPSFLMNIIANNLCSLKERQTQLLTFKQDITTIKKCLEAAAVSKPLTIERPDFPGEKNEEEERQKRRIENEQIRQEINRREKEYKDNKIGIEQPMVEVDNVQEEDRQHEGEYFHIRRKNYLKLCNIDLEYPSIQQTVLQKGQIIFSYDIHDELQYPILQ